MFYVIIDLSCYKYGRKINLNHEKTQKDLSKNELALGLFKKSL